MRTRTRGLIAVAIVVLIAAIAAGVLLREERQAASTTLYGNVDIREVELAFRVAGRLDGMLVDEGDAINAGQRLANLDDAPYRQAFAAATAGVQGAAATLAKLEHGPRRLEVEQARAQVREVEASFANADRDLKRQSDLYESRVASATTLDAARALRDEVAARLATARASLALAEEGYRIEDVAAARAALAGAKAHQEQAQIQLHDTLLLAPSDGTVLSRVREPGSILPAGAVVYTLSLDRPVYIRAYASEPDLGKVAPGTKVTITTDASATRYHGRIGFVSPRAEFTPRAVETTALRTDLVYRLRIVVEDADAGLRQGMPVTVEIEPTLDTP